jgi:hypothetical protein
VPCSRSAHLPLQRAEPSVAQMAVEKSATSDCGTPVHAARKFQRGLATQTQSSSLQLDVHSHAICWVCGKQVKARHIRQFEACGRAVPMKLVHQVAAGVPCIYTDPPLFRPPKLRRRNSSIHCHQADHNLAQPAMACGRHCFTSALFRAKRPKVLVNTTSVAALAHVSRIVRWRSR